MTPQAQPARRSNRSASQTLMIDWRATPRRCASLSSSMTRLGDETGRIEAVRLSGGKMQTLPAITYPLDRDCSGMSECALPWNPASRACPQIGDHLE